ncbi:MAG: hypothetical protein EBQ89_09895 [Alphaproteobacteria bacterium]|nr:hypothetical protein [Alphaproteobacteria bacterium]
MVLGKKQPLVIMEAKWLLLESIQIFIQAQTLELVGQQENLQDIGLVLLVVVMAQNLLRHIVEAKYIQAQIAGFLGQPEKATETGVA